MKVWVDGVLAAVEDARVSPMDHGLLTGDGVFETLRVYGGRPFAWSRHYDRLGHSAGALGLPIPDSGSLRAALPGPAMPGAPLPRRRARPAVTTR